MFFILYFVTIDGTRLLLLFSMHACNESWQCELFCCCRHRLVMKWRFSDRVRHQMAAFVSGFNEFVPHDLLKIFDENEVEVVRFVVTHFWDYVGQLIQCWNGCANVNNFSTGWAKKRGHYVWLPISLKFLNWFVWFFGTMQHCFVLNGSVNSILN